MVAAVVLRDASGRVLCVRKHGTTRFMLPGGKPEHGESRLDTALRETAEELQLSLHAEDVELLGDWFSPAANEPGQLLHSTVYLARHALTVTPSPAAEIEELAWRSLEQLTSEADIAPMLQLHVAPALADRE